MCSFLACQAQILLVVMDWYGEFSSRLHVMQL